MDRLMEIVWKLALFAAILCALIGVGRSYFHQFEPAVTDLICSTILYWFSLEVKDFDEKSDL